MWLLETLRRWAISCARQHHRNTEREEVAAMQVRISSGAGTASAKRTRLLPMEGVGAASREIESRS
eukprot:4127254-Pleurochrysis_carterae.AAC.1